VCVVDLIDLLVVASSRLLIFIHFVSYCCLHLLTTVPENHCLHLFPKSFSRCSLVTVFLCCYAESIVVLAWQC